MELGISGGWPGDAAVAEQETWGAGPMGVTHLEGNQEAGLRGIVALDDGLDADNVRGPALENTQKDDQTCLAAL